MAVSMLERPLQYQTDHSMESAGLEVRTCAAQRCLLSGSLACCLPPSVMTCTSSMAPLSQAWVSQPHRRAAVAAPFQMQAFNSSFLWGRLCRPHPAHSLSPTPDLETQRPVITAIVISFTNR